MPQIQDIHICNIPEKVAHLCQYTGIMPTPSMYHDAWPSLVIGLSGNSQQQPTAGHR